MQRVCFPWLPRRTLSMNLVSQGSAQEIYACAPQTLLKTTAMPRRKSQGLKVSATLFLLLSGANKMTFSNLYSPYTSSVFTYCRSPCWLVKAPSSSTRPSQDSCPQLTTPSSISSVTILSHRNLYLPPVGSDCEPR